MASKAIKKCPVGKSLKIIKQELNGETGMRTFHLCIVDNDGQGNIVTGPTFLHGIDHAALQNAHDGDYEKWLSEEIKPKLLKHYEGLGHQSEQAEGLSGKHL